MVEYGSDGHQPRQHRRLRDAADLRPIDETDQAKAELVANLKLELASLRSGIEELKRELGT